MNRLLNWLDRRTGFRRIIEYALYENIPGGARWRYVWGSTLVFCLSVQFMTGLFLWMSYSPSSQTAWESVYYIQNEMTGGWLLRGIHHFTASVMNVLLVLHLMQVVIDGAYKAPREINFWFGLGLLLLVLGLSLTGYLLPWDQKGYWATKVATNIMGIVPLVGPALQRLVIGGPDYGHYTLTRFFALHAGVLPACVIALLVWHIFLFRRHGITAKDPNRKPDEYFWPDQVLNDAVACLAVLATVLFLVLRPWMFHTGEDLGAELAAPADPSETYSAARPEWYFLFLFEFLKFFPGGTEIWGAIIIPTFVMLIIFLIGAVTLLRNDPLTQGPKLFAKNCAGCHRYDGRDGMGNSLKESPSASDLKGFASRAWLAGLLDPQRIDSPHYFGATKFKDGKMAKFVKKDVAGFSDEQKTQLNKIIAALSAEAELKSQRDADRRDAALIAEGKTLIAGDSMRCSECHQFHKPDEDASAPDLTGFGSRDWLMNFIANPAHARFYGKRNDRMPAFGADKVLDDHAIGLVADWLRGDWYDPSPALPLAKQGPF